MAEPAPPPRQDLSGPSRIGGAAREDAACYRVSLEPGEDGRIVARCLDLEGAISDGAGEDDAVRNITEAIEAYLEPMGRHNAFTLAIATRT